MLVVRYEVAGLEDYYTYSEKLLEKHPPPLLNQPPLIYRTSKAACLRVAPDYSDIAAAVLIQISRIPRECAIPLTNLIQDDIIIIIRFKMMHQPISFRMTSSSTNHI